MFNKWQAQRCWSENYDRLIELHNVQRFNRQALNTPLRFEDGSMTKALESQVKSKVSIKISLVDYEDFCKSEKRMLKEAFLADLAYAEMELRNPLKALTTRSLLALSECSKIYIFLGNVYAVVSLYQLNQLKETTKHLSTNLSGGSNVELPYSQEDCEQL